MQHHLDDFWFESRGKSFSENVRDENYKNLDESNRETQCMRVLNEILSNPGITDSELCFRLKLGINIITARRNDIINNPDKFGYLVLDFGKMQFPVGGNGRTISRTCWGAILIPSPSIQVHGYQSTDNKSVNTSMMEGLVVGE